MNAVTCFLLGYLAGTVNPSYLLGRFKGVDIRKKGSGNAGGSNALILFGKTAGVFCSLFDIFKAFLVIRLAEHLFPDFPLAFPLTACAVILGHIFPFYMKFRGGKGLACLGGAILAFDWRVFLVLLAVEIAVVFLTDYICFVPTTASLIFLIVYGIRTHDVSGALILLIAAASIWYRHIVNFRKIRNGTEMKFSYLWRPKEEMDRITGGNGQE